MTKKASVSTTPFLKIFVEYGPVCALQWKKADYVYAKAMKKLEDENAKVLVRELIRKENGEFMQNGDMNEKRDKKTTVEKRSVESIIRQTERIVLLANKSLSKWI